MLEKLAFLRAKMHFIEIIKQPLERSNCIRLKLIPNVLIMLMVLTTTTPVSAQPQAQPSASPIPQYDLDKLPYYQDGWYGEPLRFFVRAPKLGPETRYQAKAEAQEAQPESQISINPLTGLFTFIPGISDYNKQTLVTISASSPTGHTQSTIVVTFRFRPEYSLIGAKYPVPDPTSKNYQRITVVKDLIRTSKIFNSLPLASGVELINVHLSGKTIVLEEGTEPYSLFNYAGGRANTNIGEFVINCETLIVRSEFRLPQTNLSINASKLIFEDKGGTRASFDTTPLSYESAAPSAQGESAAGHGGRGMNAGYIVLHLGGYYIPPNTENVIRFILMGGYGQTGGKGRDGRFYGNSMDERRVCGSDGKCWDGVVCIQEGDGAEKSRTIFGDCGVNTWPGDGDDAKADGNHGDGGDGGQLSTNLHVLDFSSRSVKSIGGEPGSSEKKYWGGGSGAPHRSVKVKLRRKRRPGGGPDLIIYEHYLPQPSGSGNYHVARHGSNAAPPAPASVGKSYTVNKVIYKKESVWVWVTPELLSPAIAYARDLYLSGRLRETKNILNSYSRQIEHALNSKPVRPPSINLRLENQKLEIDTMLHRIDSNLDYFGNPAGYVPLLSFQSNLQAYRNEVESSMRVLYMTYWLKRRLSDVEARRAALKEGINQLGVIIDNDIREYNESQSRIIELEAEAAKIENEVKNIQRLLKLKEEKLRDNIIDKNKVPFWKQSLRVIGAAAKVLPVYQPALGTIGSGLDTISNIDSNEPLDTVMQFGDLAGALVDENLQKSSEDMKETLDTINLSNAEGARDYAKRIMPTAHKLRKTQEAMRKTLARTQIPQNALDAELKKIKSQDSEFKVLVEQVENLNTRKKSFAGKVAFTIQRLTQIPQEISKNLLAISTMNADSTTLAATLSPETASYLKEVEDAAKQRLLKYHYFLAKAYEYRTLEPYAGNLQLDDQFDRLVVLASANLDAPDHTVTLSQNEFNRLKAVYEVPLREIASRVISRYNNARPERRDNFTYTLQKSELEELNKGQLILDLDKIGMLLPGEENQRLIGVSISNRVPGDETTGEIKAHLDVPPGTLTDNTSLKLKYEKPNRSLLRKGTGAYLFNFPDSTIWETSYDRRRGIKTETRLSIESESLLRSFLTDEQRADAQNIFLFSTPGILGDLIIKKEVRSPDPNVHMDIDELTLNFVYEYNTTQTNRADFILNVQSPTGIAPHIEVDVPDLSGRSDGLGDFTRIYPQNSAVTLRAPLTYGRYVFKEWREGGRWSGDQLEGGSQLGVDPILPNLKINTDKRIRAIYVEPR